MTEYITSEKHLPDELDDEVTVQVTDKETKEIFVTRARIAEDPSELHDPKPLTVVHGPHENIEQQWYIEILETNMETVEIDHALLHECARRSHEGSNVINARSDDLRALLLYLVETGEYQSVSEAVRVLIREYLANEQPELIEAYVDVKADLERADLTTKLGADENR